MLPQWGMNRQQALLALSPDFDPYSDDTSGFFSSIGHALTHNPVAKVAAKVSSVAIKPLTVPGNFVAKKMSKVPILGGVYNAAHRLAIMPVVVTQQVMEGDKIDKVALRNFKQALADTKTVGPWAQTVVSFVPGIGTGVSAAIGAGLALAEGKPISEIMMAAVKGALPGGAAAQMAFNAAQAAIQRKPLDQIAISALPISDQQKALITQGLAAVKDIAAGKNVAHSIVDHAIQSLPPQYAKAVQIGMAMGHAKSLQDALKTGAAGAADIALSKAGVSDANKKLLSQGYGAAKDIAAGKNVVKSIGSHAVNAALSSSALKGAMSNQVSKYLPMVQNVLQSNHGPLGTVAAGALHQMSGGLTGKNLEKLGLATAAGAMPANIKKAIDVSGAIRNGSPLLTKALKEGLSHYAQGSHEHIGFQTAINALKSNPNIAALGAYRKSLATEGSKRAFDSAIGMISNVAHANPSLLKRAGSIPVINLSRQKGGLSPFQPNLKNAIDTLKRNPTLSTEHPMVLANKFGTSQQTVLQALKHVSGSRLLPWRSLTPGAANFIRKWAPQAPLSALSHGTADTAGLDETGTKYIVAKGDSPWSIAQKLSGNGNNWKQLIPLNADKKPSVDKGVWTGEVLNIPAAWQKPTTQVASPGPATSTQPTPVRPVASTPGKVLSTASVAPSILQAKSILVAWSKTDGVNQAGLSDYGQQAADLSTTFGPRDSMVLMSFQNWDNKTAKVGLVVDGILGPKSLAALQQWAESRAKQSVPGVPVITSTPGGGTVTTLPEVLITATPPVSPGIPQQSTALPPTPSLPTPAAVPVVTAPATSAATPPALPPVASPASPATPTSVAATTGQSGSKFGPALAGAAIGGTLGGLPGAVLGGIAGAMMS